ncbi:hypothetical protein [Klenkia soli]|uniref:hypothetical protein n=1 Tax=Klenkia soli TaxID=1052260 RepID=UPI0013F4E5B9|nr:hypothetical protein [Klenkia soli]
MATHGGYDEGRRVPWPVTALWLAVAVWLLGRSLHRRRVTRRWLAAHGSPEVAGRP